MSLFIIFGDVSVSRSQEISVEHGLSIAEYFSPTDMVNEATYQNINEEICASPPNPIVTENCQSGSSDWRVKNYSDDIQGFASATSVNLGESIDFYIDTTAPSFDLFIYRSGYYGGAGGRLIEAVRNLKGQAQPLCHTEHSTGLTSCSNWAVSYRLTIPTNWVSGIYIGKLVRPETGSENHIYFVVRDDDRDSDILYQQSVTTFQAYNPYGGKSLYNFNSSSCTTVSDAGRAVKVSIARPYNNLQAENNDRYLNVEYPMVFWLEAQGYDVTYSTNLDTHRSGKTNVHNELLDHHIFLSVGHDEYWTQEMRDAITQAHNSGVHLGFFSANTAYWRIRLEPDPWTGNPDQIIVTYKTTESGASDPSGYPTTTWRDPAGVNDPENSLVGIQYVGDNDIRHFPLQITAELAKDDIFRHTGLQKLPPDTHVNIGQHLVGWEWDAVVDNGYTPNGLVILAASPVYGALLSDSGRNYILGPATAHTTRYIAPSGAIVFASGTNHWSWGLALVEPNEYVQQITYNLFSDMGVQPATPADFLILDDEPPSDDVSLTTNTDTHLSVDGGVPKLVNVQAVTSLMAGLPNWGTATINWETDVETDGQLWILSATGPNRQTREFVSFASHEGYAYTHELTVNWLKPNTTYYYQVVSSDAGGRTTISAEGSFKTAPGSFQAEVRNLLRPTYLHLQCGFNTNRPLVIGSGVFGLAVLGLGGWKVLRRLKR